MTSTIAIFIILISIFVIVVNPSAALQQVAGPIVIEVEPGKTNTVQWGLVSDKEAGVTTVQLSAEGDGAQLLIYPKTVNIDAGQSVFVDITVTVPDDYPAGIELNPTIVATEFGETGGATVLNIQMKKTLTIKIISVAESEAEQEQIPPSDVTEETICGAGTVLVEGQCIPEEKEMEEEAESGGCLIATATYGSELTPQVQMLREIRDNTVFTTQSGALFMTAFNAFYYSFSPTVSDLERQNPAFKEVVKMTITPLISTLSVLNYVDIDSEVEMLGYGIGIIILNVGLYFVFPALVIRKLRNYLRK